MPTSRLKSRQSKTLNSPRRRVRKRRDDIRMPRLSPAAFKKIRGKSLLRNILRECRSVSAAQNELRWLKEHVEQRVRNIDARQRSLRAGQMLKHLCAQRGRGVPLQYLLGSEFFGELELICRPGVLIPRPDTAAAVTHLAEQIVSTWEETPGRPIPPLRILDLCSGSGCISLLLRHLLLKQVETLNLTLMDLIILGVDISPRAVELARLNEERTRPANYSRDRSMVGFLQADIFSEQSLIGLGLSSTLEPRAEWDVLTCNPPYISPRSFGTNTSRSVRLFEPTVALVPPRPEDTDLDLADSFYPRILELARTFNCRIVLVEVADLKQAVRVANLFRAVNHFHSVEIWRDNPSGNSDEQDSSHDCGFLVKGTGQGRSVIARRLTHQN